MSAVGSPDGSGPSPRASPPYAPRYIGLGGQPKILPDVPITAVFLFFYLVFAIVHMKIMKYNQARKHKFIFSGALFGFCKIRLITMSMRIAWAFYPRNIGLGIAAQTFVYVGTIILYICNWFFTQRVIRAQHPQFGWSIAYRVLHRAGLIVLVISLLMIIVSSIQQFFTEDDTTLHVDHIMQLAGFTYFGAFTVFPLILVFLSLMLPRKEVEKFGAGRLRNAIWILLVGSLILAVGQCFRTVIGWLPEIKVRNTEGQPNAEPWYLSTECFYVFNFLTELLVVIFYAVMRVDLRFHVPDQSKQPGDYRAARESGAFNVDLGSNESKMKGSSGATDTMHSAKSTETVHEYESSLFDDTRTLADSLRYPSSVLEVDGKTGNYKIKRVSGTVSSKNSLRFSSNSQATLWNTADNASIDEDAPPVPTIPADWPLRESQLHMSQLISRTPSRGGGEPNTTPSFISSRIMHPSTPDTERANPLEETMKKLEANGASPDQPPEYDFIAPLTPKKKREHYASSEYSFVSQKRTYLPTTGGSSTSPRKFDYSQSPRRGSTNSDLPPKKNYAPLTASSPQTIIHSASRRNTDTMDTEAVGRELAQFSFDALPGTEPGTPTSVPSSETEADKQLDKGLYH